MALNKKLAASLMDRTKAPLPGRSFVRSRGCWNCQHWSKEAAESMWNGRRPAMLSQAVNMAMSLPGGEKHPQVVKIRHEVGMVDHAIRTGAFAVCRVGKSPADLVINNFMCEDGWTAAAGVSAQDTRGDLAVPELLDILDGDKPKPTEAAKVRLPDDAPAAIVEPGSSLDA